MPRHTQDRRGQSGFKRFLRRLFSIRVGIYGSAASTAEPLHVEHGPARPNRKPARK